METNTLTIKVFGSGCPTCKRLFDLTQTAVKELDLKADVEYITDIQKMLDLGVMSAPVLTVNGKVILAGRVPDSQTIKDLIISGSQMIEKSGHSCSGGGKC